MKSLIKSFSKEQLAGQRIMAGFDGTVLDKDLEFLVNTIKVGGVILFSRNLSNPEQTKMLCRSIQECAADNGQPPLFIAIDQEGGEVARLKEPFTQFPGGNPEIKDGAAAGHFARVTADELKSIGVNMNMAPVMDVAPRDISSIMDRRVFGHDPEVVADLGVTVIRTLQENGIMSVAKHYPGIGRTTLDSHVDMPVLDADPELMRATDLVPFGAAIRSHVSGIMLSHIVYSGIDQQWPASLSRTVARDLLRDEMGFDGVVMTDDLDMGAIKKHYDIKTSVKQILAADIDIVLICHKGPDIQTAFEEILAGLTDSKETHAMGAGSVERIMKLKDRYLQL